MEMSGAVPREGSPLEPASVRRRSLRWRLALVHGATSAIFSLILLGLCALLLDRATRQGAISVDPRFVIPLGDGGFITVREYQAVLRREAVGVLLSRGFALSVALAGLGLAAAYLLSGNLLRPLRDITATARTMSATRLDARIRLDGPQDELKYLADTFDQLIDRLQAATAVQNRFLLDAGHELRTPLTVIRTELEVGLMDANAPSEEMRVSARGALRAAEQLSTKVEQLLVIGKAKSMTAGPAKPATVVDLSLAVRMALAAVSGQAASKGIVVEERLCEAPVRGDPELLQELTLALLDNAVRHSSPNALVIVETERKDDQPQLTVINDGASVPDAAAGVLTSAFRRGGTARTARQGGGLGLSIAAAVADAHGATLEALARPTGGLTVRVTFPKGSWH